METGIAKGEDERISYGSYAAAIFIGCTYMGCSHDITLWGPLTLTQLDSMYVVVEIPKQELTIFGDKEE